MTKSFQCSVLAGLSLLTLAASATPMIVPGSVSCEQNPATKLVTVTYTLGDENNQEPAIVTVDFETNVTGTAEGPWRSIGAKHFRDLAGAVNRVVEPGAHTITWRPDKGWPNHIVANGNFRATVRAWSKDDPPDYMAFVFATPAQFRFYPCEDALPGGIESDFWRKDCLLMRRIHAAGVAWRMGSPPEEVGRAGSGENTRLVTLSQDYFIGVFPFTLGNYIQVMHNGTADNPPEDWLRQMVDWSWESIRYHNASVSPDGGTWPVDKAVHPYSIIGTLRSKTGIASFDLPTAAQWQFACRAGTRTGRFTGDECPLPWSDRWTNSVDVVMNDYAWYAGNSTGLPAKVGLKHPNPWGLYDMYGSTYEWCLDWDSSSVPTEPAVDPLGPDTGSDRLTCGGAWNCGVPFCRSAVQRAFAPSTNYKGSSILGFRVACGIDIP